eukprot:Partr_v1_DN24487_c0_g1_i1_m66521 putative ATP synthase mitochondrial F1 complex assembly factor
MILGSVRPRPLHFFHQNTWRSISSALIKRGASVNMQEIEATPTPPQAKKHGVSDKLLLRFWKEVEVDGNSKDGYVIKLDGRQLKTPGTNVLTVTSKPLALLVAAEWQNQEGILKRTHSLPITSLVSRSIDHFESRDAREVVARGFLAKYLDTDTLCCRHEYPQRLVDLESQSWTPIVEWARDRFKVDILTTTSLLGLKQPVETRDRLVSHVVATYGPGKMAAFEKAVMQSKSFLVALALMERAVTVEQASFAARVEYISQAGQWGEVEDTHDVDAAEMARQLGACAAMLLQ